MDGPGAIAPLRTARLLLRPLSASGIEAWLADDRRRFESITGARLPKSGGIPPLLADALPFTQKRLVDHPEEDGRWIWLFCRLDTGELVGTGGFAGMPDARGATMLGYSLYPHAEGHGYATEAAKALVNWALTDGGYSAVKATIPPGHQRSIRVAERLGMREIGRDTDPEVGEVLVFWRDTGDR